jgi:hypothetical protein
MLKTYLLAFIVGIQTFVGVNLTNDIIETRNNNQSYESRPVAMGGVSEDVKTAENEEDYIRKIQAMGITLHPGKEFDQASTDDPEATGKCAALVYRTLQVMPEKPVKQIKNLTLYFSSEGRRGLGGGSTIILRCQNVVDEELVSVLVHELGHIQDTGVMQGNFWVKESEFRDGQSSIYLDDPSLDFYRISFKNEKALKKDATEEDFVTGYAMSDPFEDFAETYNYYLLHGASFREMIKHNQSLKSKYEFMRDKVFEGKEYSYDSNGLNDLFTAKNYDSTVIGFNLKKFLAYS